MGGREMSIKVVISAIDQASDKLKAITGSMNGLEMKLRGAQAASEQFNNKWSATMSAARGVGTAMTAAGAGAMALAKSGLDASMEMEGYGAKLQTAMKDTAKAAEMMEWAKKTAAQTPFEMPDVVDATAKLEMYGLSAKEWFPAIGDMAGAMGKDVVDGVEAIADAVSGGGLERLKEFGVTGEQLKQFGWSGDYSAKGIDSLKVALQGLLGERFEGGMANMTQTSRGALSNFSDAIFQLRAAIGDALAPILKSLTPMLVQVATTLADIAKNPVGQFFIKAGAALGAFMLVVGPLLMALPTIASGFVFINALLGGAGLAGALAAVAGPAATAAGGLTAAGAAAGGAATATAGLGATLAGFAAAAVPVLIVVAALAALGYELYKLKQSWDAAAEAGRKAKESWRQAAEVEMQAATARGAGDIAAQQAQERARAPITFGDRFWGAVTGGGVTARDLASQREHAKQASPLWEDMRRKGRVRASGGPVRADELYLVGEQGPELFIPDTSGRIATMDQAAAEAASAEQYEQEMAAIDARVAAGPERRLQSRLQPRPQPAVTGPPMIPAMRTDAQQPREIILRVELDPGLVARDLQQDPARGVVVQIARATTAKAPAAGKW